MIEQEVLAKQIDDTKKLVFTNDKSRKILNKSKSK